MCRCSAFMDIRGRCDYSYNPQEWKVCRAKIDTALFHIENDYECDKIINTDGFDNKYVKNYAKKTLKLTDEEWEKVVLLRIENE
jgi:hypothetical protein